MNKLCKSYADLKEKAIDSSNRNGKFDITPLKELFRSEINSERTYSQINDLFSLITTLEKRAVLSPKNIDTFEIIFNALNLSLDTLNKHKSLIDHRAEGFSKSAVANNRSEPIPSALNDRSKTANVQHKLSDEVVRAVASQIGYSWKGLARYLGCVKEGIIEKIEEDPSIKTNEMRARLMLAEYEREVDPCNLNSKLLKALELSKRKDIYEQVLKILLREARLNIL